VVVGGGIAGLGAAYELEKSAPTATCLILENHPIFGGAAKRNEFLVDGHRLVAPQGSNGFSVPGVDQGEHASSDARYYHQLGIPRRFSYQRLDDDRNLRFGTDNYGFLYWLEKDASVGYFFDTGQKKMVRDPWQSDLKDTPFTDLERRQLLEWRHTDKRPAGQKDFERWLDGMSYAEYIEKEMALGPKVAAYADPILASAVGLGCDAVSAYAAYSILFPGVINFYPPEVKDLTKFERHSFPGGNDGFARYFVKRIIPTAIAGGDSFEDINNGKVDLTALDAAGQRIRMRVGATVVGVEHQGEPGKAEKVVVTYAKGPKLYRLRARGVVMAAGGWMNKHVVRDLPAVHHAAFDSLQHAAFLVANVAVKNWRFMYDLGITACRYQGRFGYSCNIRQPMSVGGYRPSLDPDEPTVLNFYVPLIYPGLSVRAQCARGRMELLSTSYAEYESLISSQLSDLFGNSFDPERDLAGIILNRWGHAFVVPEPGFFFGRNGEPAARGVIREAHGRVAFGHSELRGNQHWGSAADEGGRAMRQILEQL
jgi:spermidine dehydrogenase